ncbi:MAG: hypothetical protein KDD40_08325 [Bdellovibrionales bacterium]|nr:hypothetical protein [Bdellovibrionales bacterium]
MKKQISYILLLLFPLISFGDDLTVNEQLQDKTVHFKIDAIEQEYNITEDSFPHGEVQTNYIYDRNSNTVLRRTVKLPGRSRFESSMSASTYYSYWTLAIDAKNLFEIKYSLDDLEIKYRDTEAHPKFGADYMRELAHILQKILKIKNSDVYISDNYDNSLSLSTLKISMISRINNIVFFAKQKKNRFVYNSFWKELQTIGFPEMRSVLENHNWTDLLLSDVESTKYSQLSLKVCEGLL